MRNQWEQFAAKTFLSLYLCMSHSHLPVLAMCQTPANNVGPSLTELANSGNVKAQLLVAHAYYAGDGAPLDSIKAATWYVKAAENGDATAQLTLGLSNIYGLFGTRDRALAESWLRKASRHADLIDLPEVPAILVALDNPYAQLGLLYQDGKELPQDYSQAAFWYRQGAEAGDRSSQLLLGVLYFDGKGVPQDFAQAGTWFRKAALQGDMEAQANLGELYLAGHGVPQDFQKAKEWLEKAADQGDARAAYSMGIMYAKGQGVPQNNGAAYMLFDIAAARLDGADQVDAEKARDLVASMLTPEVLSSAQAAAEKWFARFPDRK